MPLRRNREALRSEPLLSNSTYDTGKWVATILLPAVGALYFGIAQIWGLPAAEEVVGTIVTIEVFLGAILGISTKQYNNSEAKYDGALVVDTTNPEKDVLTVEVDKHPMDLVEKQDLTLKVVKP